MFILESLSLNKFKKRIEWIDVARALSMFIIIYAHIYDDAQITRFVHLFHVPVFFFLSGIVWKNKNRKFGTVCWNSFKSLMIPFYVCSIISIAVYLVLGKFVPSKGDSLSVLQCLGGMLYANSRTGLMNWNRPLWFIPCLFVVRILWEIIVRLVKSEKMRAVTVASVFVIGMLISYFFNGIKMPFELEISLVMLFYYYLGAKADFIRTAMEKYNWKLYVPAFIVSLGACIPIYIFNGDISVQMSRYGNPVLFVLGSIAGTFMVISVSGLLAKLKVLQFVGQNTLSILLWHKFPILLFQITPIGKKMCKNPDYPLSILTGLLLVAAVSALCLLVAYFISAITESFVRKDPVLDKRDLLFDNLKGVLIILVVLGHLLAGDGNEHMNVFGITHYFIYAVHMPMFILISGYFSKSEYTWRKFLKTCIIPYIIFNLLYTLFTVVLGGADGSFNILIAQNGYWYILCIGIMRMLYVLIKRIYILIPVSVLISVPLVFVSEDIWRFLSLGRVFLLMPIFLIGIKLSNKEIDFVRTKKLLFAGIGVLCLAGEFLLLYFNVVNTHWATHNQPDSIVNLLLKYGYMLIFTLGCFGALVSLIPRFNIPVITQCGRNSVTVYLIHFFVVKVVLWGIKKVHLNWNIPLFAGLVVLSVIIAYLLSLDVITGLYRKIMNAICRFLHIDKKIEKQKT